MFQWPENQFRRKGRLSCKKTSSLKLFFHLDKHFFASMDRETIRTIVGVIGNVISFGLFTSPIPTCIKIIKGKSVQQFKPDPYLATVLNCAMWVFYGMPFVHPDSVLVVTINSIGLIMELIYVMIFVVYSTWGKRSKIFLVLLIELAFFVVLVFVTLKFVHGTKNRSLVIGLVCIVFNIIMYASPLTVMKRVITTKSVKYMPFLLSLANFLNGIVWVIYAALKFDPYILVPNGLGALSGLVQLILYAIYYRTTNWDEEPAAKQTEVQLADRTPPV